MLAACPPDSQSVQILHRALGVLPCITKSPPCQVACARLLHHACSQHLGVKAWRSASIAPQPTSMVLEAGA